MSDLDELRALLAAATPGPWFRQAMLVHGPDHGGIDIGPLLGWHDWSDADAALIVWLRNHAEALLDDSLDAAWTDAEAAAEAKGPYWSAPTAILPWGGSGLWSAVAEGGEFGRSSERIEAHAPTADGALRALAAKLRAKP